MSIFEQRMASLRAEQQALLTKPNQPCSGGNGVFERWLHPVLTADHVPLHWCYDLDPRRNPFALERLGVNAVFDGFRFRALPMELPETREPATNVYDMRLTVHEDGWIYGVFCVERHDPRRPEDPTAAGLRYVLYLFVTRREQPWVVKHAPGGYLLAPEGEERTGDVGNVVFCSGWTARPNGEVFIYYGASDTRVHVATTSVERLLDYARNTPPDAGASSACVRQRMSLAQRNLALDGASGQYHDS